MHEHWHYTRLLLSPGEPFFGRWITHSITGKGSPGLQQIWMQRFSVCELCVSDWESAYVVHGFILAWLDPALVQIWRYDFIWPALILHTCHHEPRLIFLRRMNLWHHHWERFTWASKKRRWNPCSRREWLVFSPG